MLVSGPDWFWRKDTAEPEVVPKFVVDAFWPQPLPNHWLLGQVPAIDVDPDGNIWIIHRPQTIGKYETYPLWDPPAAACCIPAPEVLSFSPTGRVTQAWNIPYSPEFDVTEIMRHGLDIDTSGSIWITLVLFSSSMSEHRVLKLSPNGTLLANIRPFSRAGYVASLLLPAATEVNLASNTLFIADGYGNKRVIALDAATGEYKRSWGAYGSSPDNSLFQGRYYRTDLNFNYTRFEGPIHAIERSTDGLLYVSDRTNNRIQVFTEDGSFVTEGWVCEGTGAWGSTSDFSFSHDSEQTYLYVADMTNQQVHVLHRRSLRRLTSFGRLGRNAGQFFGVHGIATDAQGNIFTAEVLNGHRVQKFVFNGLVPISSDG